MSCAFDGLYYKVGLYYSGGINTMRPIQALGAATINKVIFRAFGVKFIVDGIQIGDGTTEGDWKMVKVGTDWIRYRMESSVWVDKGAFLA